MSEKGWFGGASPEGHPSREESAESSQGWFGGGESESSEAREKELAKEAPAEVPAPEAPAARTYTVVSGDTLWAISERFYGDGNQYQRIADASGISNPDLIYPGQVLTIP